MRRYLIQGLMENLKIWIDIESSSMYRKLYVGYYNLLQEKLDKV